MNGRTIGSTAGRTVGAGIRGLIYMIIGTVVIGLVITLATAAHVWAYARQDDRAGADTILVLGAAQYNGCLLYTSPSPRDRTRSRMPSSA